MLRASPFRNRHQNTSLPQDMIMPPTNFTRQMVSPVRESATWRRPNESMPPGFPGKMDYATHSGIPMDGRFEDASVESDGFSTSATVVVVVQTNNIQTVTAKTELTSAFPAPPVGTSADLTSGTASSHSTSPNVAPAMGNEGNLAPVL